jgi:hypothetical protein
MKTRLVFEMAKKKGYRVQQLAESEYQLDGKFFCAQFFDDGGKAICVEVRSPDQPEGPGLFCKSVATLDLFLGLKFDPKQPK